MYAASIGFSFVIITFVLVFAAHLIIKKLFKDDRGDKK